MSFPEAIKRRFHVLEDETRRRKLIGAQRGQQSSAAVKIRDAVECVEAAAEVTSTI
jgi:hypothetical protein